MLSNTMRLAPSVSRCSRSSSGHSRQKTCICATLLRVAVPAVSYCGMAHDFAELIPKDFFLSTPDCSGANMVPSPPHLTTCKVQGPQVIQRPAQPVIKDIRVAGYALELYFDRPREEEASSPVTFRAYLYDKGRTGEALAEGRSSPLCMTGLKTGEVRACHPNAT